MESKTQAQLKQEEQTQDQLKQEFYAQLTPVQQVGAKIAAKMLGSSYIVEKTKGYLHWLKNVKLQN
jgi:hypothetical protein